MLGALDYAVLAIYAVVVIAVCVRVTRASPDADDLFLAGRSLGWGVVGLSLFASNISSTTLIGLPGAAWKSGIAVANYEWMAGLVLLFSTFWVIPKFLSARVTTIPEWLEKRFDVRMRRYLSVVTIVLSIFLDTAGSLYAGSVVLMQFFPSLPLAPTCFAIALFAGLYTAAGGLRAVAYTDVVQAIVLLAASAVLAWLVFGQFGYSLAEVEKRVPADHLSLIRPSSDPDLPWTGTLIGLPILGFYYWTMNQYVSQRLLGARNMQAAGFGAVLAAALKLLPLFLMVLPGAMATALFTDLDRSDAVFPKLVATYAPTGIAGLILAGLLAAIMSSVDSALNSCSTLISVDFVQRKRHLETHQLARLGRWTTMVLVVVAAVWAPMIDRFPGLFGYLQVGFSYVASPLVGTFLIALFVPRVGAAAALTGTLCGHAFSAVLFVGSLLGVLQIHFTLAAGLVTLFTALVVLGGALLIGEQSRNDQRRAVQTLPEHVPSRRVAIGASVVVALTVLLVVTWA